MRNSLGVPVHMKGTIIQSYLFYTFLTEEREREKESVCVGVCDLLVHSGCSTLKMREEMQVI